MTAPTCEYGYKLDTLDFHFSVECIFSWWARGCCDVLMNIVMALILLQLLARVSPQIRSNTTIIGLAVSPTKGWQRKYTCSHFWGDSDIKCLISNSDWDFIHISQNWRNYKWTPTIILHCLKRLSPFTFNCNYLIFRFINTLHHILYTTCFSIL